MGNPEKLICEYCGAEKEEISFCIGASLKPEWTMHEGTGKVSCGDPVCHLQGETEGQAAINNHIKTYNKECTS